jgi:nitrous oxidase accessory protein NosD/nitrous oxide reductase accessory protein NosL
MRLSETVGLVLVVLLVGAGSAFAVSPAPDQQFSPVAIDETLETGLTGVDVQIARTHGYEIPRAQVFYSQLRYVVGYYGIGTAADALADETTTDRFGQPLAVFVTDFSGTDPTLTEEGYVTLRNEGYRTWTRASEAVYVVDSRAATPAGSAVLPFSDSADARAFADRADGRVVDWAAVGATHSPESWDTVLDRRRSNRTAWADATVERSRAALDRPVSIVVGEDAPTLDAAVEQAPPNTTVRLPPGRFEANLTVAKPLTIRGAGNGTVLDGGGVGTVVTLAAPRTALADLRIEGVGDSDIGNASRGNATGWDARIQLIYGHGDAAVRLADATDGLVADVTIDTSSNGVVLLESDGAVVDGINVTGAERWEEGFMGALPMHSRAVVQHSTFEGGRDGVYTHRADGTVIRENAMSGMRFGVHEMYTSDLLVANNSVSRTRTGIVLMTRPRGNLVLDNEVGRSEAGVSTAGSETIVAGNRLVSNGIGLAIGTDRSTYVRNTIVGNDLGIREETVLPTDEVFANDVVGNEKPVETGRGVLLVWARDGAGNYWGDVPGLDRDGDGIVDRAFRATDVVDRQALTGGGPAVLARSPAVVIGRAVEGTIPGLRPSGVLDPAPLADPVRGAVLAAVRNGSSDSAGGGPA